MLFLALNCAEKEFFIPPVCFSCTDCDKSFFHDVMKLLYNKENAALTLSPGIGHKPVLSQLPCKQK